MPGNSELRLFAQMQRRCEDFKALCVLKGLVFRRNVLEIWQPSEPCAQVVRVQATCKTGPHERPRRIRLSHRLHHIDPGHFPFVRDPSAIILVGRVNRRPRLFKPPRRQKTLGDFCSTSE